MKTILRMLFCALVCTSCHATKSDNNKKRYTNMQQNSEHRLNYIELKDTKWIIGKIGINGERPDTIIFNSPDKLIYVSSEIGKETCYYSISNDTLTYINYCFKYDYNKKDDVKVKNTNKLVLQANKLYFTEMVEQVSKEIKVEDLRDRNLYFTKIK